MGDQFGGQGLDWPANRLRRGAQSGAECRIELKFQFAIGHWRMVCLVTLPVNV